MDMSLRMLSCHWKHVSQCKLKYHALVLVCFELRTCQIKDPRSLDKTNQINVGAKPNYNVIQCIYDTLYMQYIKI